MVTQARRFLMLQGPHGPFFSDLADALKRSGHSVHRIGFNSGDALFWPGENYTRYNDRPEYWRTFFKEFLFKQRITDVVLYGDIRDRHSEAVRICKDRGLQLHIFEEGYLRPYWCTYERSGTNGYSPIMDISIAQMRMALAFWGRDMREVPATWGELRQHIYYGTRYHTQVLFGNKSYQNFVAHRQRSLRDEFSSSCKHMRSMPFKALRRMRSERRIKRGRFPYSLVLLQLAHDASIQEHSSFRDMISVIRLCLQDFAKAAPPHQHLVFKAHPLEDYFQPLAEYTLARAEQLGIRGRVHFVEGGKLADLLDHSNSVVTVNSTAAQQALWRGLPVKCLGRSVYDKPSLVSDQKLVEFFRDPKHPDRDDYMFYRRFLLETCQIRGGFYSRDGREALIRELVPRMLEDECRYTRLLGPLPVLTPQPEVQERLRLVK